MDSGVRRELAGGVGGVLTVRLTDPTVSFGRFLCATVRLSWIVGVVVDPGGDVVTADNAGHPARGRAATSVDELFQGSAPVRSAEDLAEDGVFDDGEVQEFLTDLDMLRRADVA